MMKFLKMLVGTSLAFAARNAVAISNNNCANEFGRSFPAQTELESSEETSLEKLSQEVLSQEELSQEMKDLLQNQMQSIVGSSSCVVEVLRPDVSSAVIKGGY